AELDGRSGEFCDIDDVGQRKERFELLDAALVEALLLLGSVIFGVLRKVAVGPGLGNGGDDFWTAFGRALTIFLAQRGVAGRGHRNLVHRGSPWLPTTQKPR